jgi:hypothetical protein
MMITVASLMRVFVKEALQVAGQYVHAQHRHTVDAVDMQKALKYVARTFFEKEDSALTKSVEEEIDIMENESETESGEESSNDCEESADSESAGSESAEQGPCALADVQLARRVDGICLHWDMWKPEDPIHQLLKKAIDNTAA